MRHLNCCPPLAMSLDLAQKEVLAAAPDALALAFGVPVRKPHPAAVHGLPVPTIADACAQSAGRFVPAGAGSNQVVGAALSTSDFGRLLADAVRSVVVLTYQGGSVNHLRFTTQLPMRDFNAQPLPALDTDIALDLVHPDGEITSVQTVTAAGRVTAQLGHYGKILRVSRQVLVNDDKGSIAALARSAGTGGLRKEARLVYAALEAAASINLDDGAPTYNAANTHAAALDAAALSVAMGKLRSMVTVPGQAQDTRAAHLVVAAELELIAAKILADSGLQDRIELHATANLPAGRWYVLADPAEQPAVAVLRLAGSSQPFDVASGRLKDYDGLGIRVVAYLGAAVVSRTGLVRCGADLA